MIFDALARFSASIQKSSSTKLSLTGRCTPWMTNVSRPRTFSRMRTKTLPSLKIWASQGTSFCPSASAMLFANTGLPEPARIARSPREDSIVEWTAKVDVLEAAHLNCTVCDCIRLAKVSWRKSRNSSQISPRSVTGHKLDFLRHGQTYRKSASHPHG